ncbi:MAG: transposase [Bacteroidota bacterium]
MRWRPCSTSTPARTTRRAPSSASRPAEAGGEKRKQLVRETRAGFTDSRGVRHEDYEYERCGVGVLYMVCEPLGCRREVLVERSQDRLAWARTVRYVAEAMYPGAERITLVQDNLAAHKPSALYEILPPERARAILSRLEMVHTPKHGSWLNVAEIELSVVGRQVLSGRIEDEDALRGVTERWSRERTASQKGVDWQFTTADARVKLKRLYPSYSLR